MLITFLITFILIYIAFKLINKFSSSQLTDLDKRVIFITGCDSGIGNALARYFHSLGFIIFAGCLDLSSKGISDLTLLNEIDKNKSSTKNICSNKRIHIVQIDITKTDSVKNAVDRLNQFLDKNNELKFHALINNAGVCIVGEFDWFSLEHIEKVINVNLIGTLRTIKLFLKLIIKYKSRIITIGSVNGIYAYPGIAVYCATKAALNLFSQSLRFELNKFGIKVCILNPGDYANKTNIMSNQSIYFEQMIANFSIEQQILYKDYIEKYIELTNQNIGVTGSEGSETKLFNDLNSLLTHSNPPVEILSIPLLNRIILTIFFSLPCKLQLLIFQIVWNKVLKFKDLSDCNRLK